MLFSPLVLRYWIAKGYEKRFGQSFVAMEGIYWLYLMTVRRRRNEHIFCTINPFHVIDLFPYTLKTPEDLLFWRSSCTKWVKSTGLTLLKFSVYRPKDLIKFGFQFYRKMVLKRIRKEVFLDLSVSIECCMIQEVHYKHGEWKKKKTRSYWLVTEYLNSYFY